jgi:hypothetical protein
VFLSGQAQPAYIKPNLASAKAGLQNRGRAGFAGHYKACRPSRLRTLPRTPAIHLIPGLRRSLKPRDRPPSRHRLDSSPIGSRKEKLGQMAKLRRARFSPRTASVISAFILIAVRSEMFQDSLCYSPLLRFLRRLGPFPLGVVSTLWSEEG